MINILRSKISITLIFILFMWESQAQKIPDQVVETLQFRAIGPTRQGGRYVDFAVVDKSPKVFYAATASGGL